MGESESERARGRERERKKARGRQRNPNTAVSEPWHFLQFKLFFRHDSRKYIVVGGAISEEKGAVWVVSIKSGTFSP